MNQNEGISEDSDKMLAFGLEQVKKLRRRLQHDLKTIDLSEDDTNISPQSYEEDPASLVAKFGSDSQSVECGVVRTLFVDYILDHCNQQEDDRLEKHLVHCKECTILLKLTHGIIVKLMEGEPEE